MRSLAGFHEQRTVAALAAGALVVVVRLGRPLEAVGRRFSVTFNNNKVSNGRRWRGQRKRRTCTAACRACTDSRGWWTLAAAG